MPAGSAANWPAPGAMLDIALVLAWVLLAVAALIGVEYGLIRLMRAEFERWREAAQPCGVKQ